MITLPISTCVGFGIAIIMALIGIWGYAGSLKYDIQEVEKKLQNHPAAGYLADTQSTFITDDWRDMPHEKKQEKACYQMGSQKRCRTGVERNKVG